MICRLVLSVFINTTCIRHDKARMSAWSLITRFHSESSANASYVPRHNFQTVWACAYFFRFGANYLGHGLRTHINTRVRNTYVPNTSTNANTNWIRHLHPPTLTRTDLLIEFVHGDPRPSAHEMAVDTCACGSVNAHHRGCWFLDAWLRGMYAPCSPHLSNSSPMMFLRCFGCTKVNINTQTCLCTCAHPHLNICVIPMWRCM